MLRSLSIRNFVLIADATIETGAGLTVLTGETGAGKTLLTQALELLLGERAADDMIGPAADEARVQIVYDLEAGQVDLMPRDVVDLAELDTGELIATRRLMRGGKNRCYLNDTACTLSTLEQALRPLLAFSGQHEHRRLVEPSYQRAVLDALGGPALADAKRRYREAWSDTTSAERLLEEQLSLRENRRTERELLAFQVEELEDANLAIEEEQELALEQRRLARAEEILTVAGRSAELLRSDMEGSDAAGKAEEAASLLRGVADVDERLADVGSRVSEAAILLEDAARDLRSYASGVEIDPERLVEVEERLALYTALARKYGGSTEAAVTHRTHGRERLQELVREDEDFSELEDRVAAGRERCVALAEELSRARADTAPALVESVERHLADLGMEQTVLEVSLETALEWKALGAEGGDAVEFLVAPNPGLPLRSLRRIASGGELSRTLLALKAALAGVEAPETLIFDEIDAGIGGRVATAVGAKLKALSRDVQLLVITHLPQVAAFADHHIRIDKTQVDGRTVTGLSPLDESRSLEELCRMMGGEPGESSALDHARRLRDKAAAGLID